MAITKTWDNTISVDAERNKVTYEGLSTDSKPTEDVGVNDEFRELDTGDVYYYSGSEWVKGVSSGGGGSGGVLPIIQAEFYMGMVLPSKLIGQASPALGNAHIWSIDPNNESITTILMIAPQILIDAEDSKTVLDNTYYYFDNGSFTPVAGYPSIRAIHLYDAFFPHINNGDLEVTAVYEVAIDYDTGICYIKQ